MSKVCACGNPIPSNRSKHCSDGCYQQAHAESMATRYRNRFLPPDAPDPDPLAEYARMPAEFVGAWFTTEELREKNRELALVGRRICRVHQGAALLLNEENFYYRDRAKGTFRYECKACECKRAQAAHELICLDPERHAVYRRQKRASSKTYRRRHNAKVILSDRRRRRKNVFTRLYGVAS